LFRLCSIAESDAKNTRDAVDRETTEHEIEDAPARATIKTLVTGILPLPRRESREHCNHD
jgi:hypothetical protein